MKNLIITALIFLAAVGLAFAGDGAKRNFSGMEIMMGNNHGEGIMNNGGDMEGMMMDMHRSDGMMGGGCMGMMQNAGSMTKEEKEKMLADTDKDGDGICDMCGMTIEACRKMMGI